MNKFRTVPLEKNSRPRYPREGKTNNKNMTATQRGDLNKGRLKKSVHGAMRRYRKKCGANNMNEDQLSLKHSRMIT